MHCFSPLMFPIKVDFLPFNPCILHEINFLVYFIGIYARSGDVGPKLDGESRLWILSTLLAVVDNLGRYVVAPWCRPLSTLVYSIVRYTRKAC